MTDLTLIVVADTGPLIALARLKMLEPLAALPWQFCAPAAVVRKATADASKPGAQAISRALANGSLTKQNPNKTPVTETLEQLLDEGEAAAIALAVELSATLLIDERRGRKVAKHRGIHVIGTGALLLHAKRQGLIELIGPQLDELRAMGYRLSDSLVTELKRMAGERE